MRQLVTEFEVVSRPSRATDVTRQIRDWVHGSGITTGLLTLHCRHTSASLIVQENADPQVLSDLEAFLRRLVPPGDPLFGHDAEGPDDMPAHVRSALTATTLSLPVLAGAPALGTWQAIYLYEHRHQPHRRVLVAHLLGD